MSWLKLYHNRGVVGVGGGGVTLCPKATDELMGGTRPLELLLSFPIRCDTISSRLQNRYWDKKLSSSTVNGLITAANNHDYYIIA